jgi:uncharacterized NAD(P)/FAD-binding protein YdhS/predicted metal-dependent enzyme (double-stranded beta helix superfamily)
MNALQGRLGELVTRLDTLRDHSLTKLADALSGVKLTAADVTDYVRESPRNYNRSLVMRRDGYELLILTWKPGQGSVPHDHAGSISAMQVLQGEAVEGSWRIGPDGYVTQEFETPVRCGEMTAWQDAGVHTVRNSSKTTLVTVHVYAPPLKDFRRFVPRPDSSIESEATTGDIPSIVVVGGGFSGSMTAAQILRRAGSNGVAVRVFVVERQGAVGEGLAYATSDLAHLLNVPAGKMSAWPDRPDDFLQWVSRRYRPAAAGEFLPRRWYGEYIRESLTTVAREADPSASLTVVFDEVRRIARRPAGGWMVSFARGTSLRADAVVLALGHRPPPDPIGSLWSGPRSRFIADPWRPFSANGVQANETVAILGSGLTAIDAVLSLSQESRQAPITLISRRGLLPQSHAASPAAPLDLKPLVTDLLALPPDLRVVTVCRTIRSRIRELVAAGGDWRSAIDGLRPYTAALWKALATPERRQFLNHLRPYWEIHRHRMAIDVAKTFESLHRTGAVRIVAGTVASAQADENGVRLYVRERGDCRLIELHTAWIINCTGPAASNSAESNPAIGSLLVHGWVRPDDLSLGLDTTADGNAVDARGAIVQDLFVVGTLRKPLLWESTAVPELRGQAAAVAEGILSRPQFWRAKLGERMHMSMAHVGS